MPSLLALKTITFICDQREDRIRAAVNASSTEAWSCWLTRRLVLALLAKADEFFSSTSALAQRSPSGMRDELASFEREAALAQTAGSISATPRDVLAAKDSAELLHSVTLNRQGEKYQLVMHGHAGGGAASDLSRSELQRIIQMLREVASKAGWIETASLGRSPSAATHIRH